MRTATLPATGNSASDVEKGSHQNLRRILAVVKLLGEAPEVGLRAIDVTNASGLGRATAHRLLSGLASHGIAQYDERSGKYFIGRKVIEWSFAALNRNGLAEAAADVLQELALTTGDTIYLMLHAQDGAHCIDCRDGSFPIRTHVAQVGQGLELSSGALGVAILAFLPDSATKASPLQPDDEAALRLELEQARRIGYAIDEGRSARGVTSVGVPIHSTQSTLLGAIGLSAISTRLDQSRRTYVGKLLLQGAREIERILAENVPPS